MSGLLIAFGTGAAVFAVPMWWTAYVWSTGATTRDHADTALGALVVFLACIVAANLLIGYGLARVQTTSVRARSR